MVVLHGWLKLTVFYQNYSKSKHVLFPEISSKDVICDNLKLHKLDNVNYTMKYGQIMTKWIIVETSYNQKSIKVLES